MPKKLARRDDLTPDARNANKGTERGRYMLEQSLREVGAGRSIVTDKEGRVIAGNKTLECAEELGLPIRTVVTNGTELVVVQREDLDLETDERARKLAFYDNRTSEVDLSWDAAQIAAEIETGLDLSSMFREEELSKILEQAADELLDDAGEMNLDEPPEEELTSRDVPDARFATDNEWDIPTLDIRMQATALELPFDPWGSMARTKKHGGTYHFYTGDYRFEALWKDPSPIVNSQCLAVVEPNFTVSLQSPKAYVLWNVYRKRWLARYWQNVGIRTWVDLNVPAEFAELTFLGVPKEWRAYITRGYSDRLEATIAEHDAACEHHGSNDILFVVYGGGNAVRVECNARGWVWVPEDASVKRGKIDG